MSLMQKYAECPNCGNEKIGNGFGALIIEEEMLYRSCECGYEKLVDEDDVELDLSIVKPYLKKR